MLCHPALADFRGRRVSEVLDELRSQGLTFIYNTQIVPADLRVAAEPGARHGIELAREILAARGLGLLQAAPGVYSVVLAPASAEPTSPSREPTASGPSPVEEVIVQTSRYSLAADTAVSTFLTQEQVKNMPRLADEPLRAVQRLPGTATNGVSSLGPVRGGEPNETAIVLDGLRLYEPFHLKNFLNPVSLLDSRLIDGIDFYAGGFPVPYGDRMTAIIDARSVRPAAPRYYELGLNVFHASALAAARFADGRGEALVSARRSNLGDLVKLGDEDFGEPHYSDGFARVAYQLDEDTHAALDVLLSSDSIRARRSSGQQRATARYRNVYTWATLDHDWSERAASRLIASFTDLSNLRRGEVNEPGIRVGRVDDERIFHVIGLRLENSLATGPLDHRFGVEVRRLWGDYEYFSELTVEPQVPFPGSAGFSSSRMLAPSPSGYENSAYWDARARLGSRWTVQGGLRIDTQSYDGSDDGEQISPRLSVLYALAPQTHLRASWGRYFQYQGINELQVEDGIDTFHPAQHADHMIVSFDHSFGAGLDLRLEAFRKDYARINPRFENLFDQLALLPELEFDRVRLDPQGAQVSGVELLVRLKPRGSWSGWLSYTWSQARDRIDDRDVPRSWDQRHAINLGVVWSSGPWTATLVDSYHSGWPTTRLELAEDPQLALDARNRSRLDFYNALDLRVTRTYALARGALDVFLEINNALSRDNPCCTEYDVTRNADGSLRYSRDDNFWLPLVPSIGVLWRY